MRAFLLSAVLLVVSGCMVDGANGENGVVRFSQMVDYKETQGFDARIALGRTILVRLEHADARANEQARQPGFPELGLRVDGGGSRIFPLGFGQYGVVFETAGTHTLIAQVDGKDVDRLKVEVAAMRGLRFSPKANVVTMLRGANSVCFRGSEVDLADFVLRENQSVKLDAIPLDDDGNAMIGFLSVRATSDSEAVTLDTPLFYEGGAPNTLVVGGTGALGDAVTVTAIEENGAQTSVKLDTAAGEAPGTCD
jgi:hypothetical protein